MVLLLDVPFMACRDVARYGRAMRVQAIQGKDNLVAPEVYGAPSSHPRVSGGILEVWPGAFRLGRL
jgi:hypothetical protein